MLTHRIVNGARMLCEFNESVWGGLCAVWRTELISRYTFERNENLLQSGSRVFSSRTHMHIHQNVHSTSAGELAIIFMYINECTREWVRVRCVVLCRVLANFHHKLPFLSNSKKHSPSSEANNCLSGQKFPRLLPKFTPFLIWFKIYHRMVPLTKPTQPIPVAAPSTALVCGSSLAGIARSSPVGGMDICL